jgi:GGDEF domain-containing protein
MLIEAFTETTGTEGTKSVKRAVFTQRDSAKLIKSLSDLKLDSDIIGHFETFGFALLMPETDDQQVRIVSERLTEALDNLDMHGPLGEVLTVRVGAVSVPQETASLEEALGIARSRLEIKFT